MPGTIKKKTIKEPCRVNSTLYVCGETMSASGVKSSVLITIAIEPAMIKNIEIETRYNIPILL